MARVEVVLGVDGALLMAPNNPVFLAALRVAELDLQWNQQYQCWWAPAYQYFALMAVVREFFELAEDYPDDYVQKAIDPFRRYPGLATLLPELRSGQAKLRRQGGDLYAVRPEQGGTPVALTPA